MKILISLFTAFMILGVSEPKLAHRQSAKEVVVVELMIENVLELQRIELPINKNPLSAGKGKAGGGSYKDKSGTYFYALDALELNARKVKVNFTASLDPHNSLKREFVVVRGKKSKHEFGHGISIVAYFGKASPNKALQLTAR